MSESVSLVRPARQLLSSVITLAAATAFAQVAPSSSSSATSADSAIPLDRLVISASRTPQDVRVTPSSVSVVPLDDLRSAQVLSLSTALGQEPGVVVTNTGAPGGQSSVFIRGATPEQTLFIVDGVRMNERSAAYFNFLGGADLGGTGRIEVLRGPQSTLYGSSAMGGVIVLETEKGCGPLSGSISATGGSFDTYGAAISAKGSAGDLGYSASVAHLETANDRPANEFREWTYSTRLEYAASPVLLLGATFRGLNGNYEEPGSRFYPAPGTVTSENALTTVYAQVRPTEDFTSRLTLGSHLRQYSWRGPWYYAPQSNNREILDWQNTWAPAKTAEIVAGANIESARYVIDGAADSDHIAAGYASATYRPVSSLTLTAGVRDDHYRSVGSATTGRGGIAWLPVQGLKLHGTYGTGFNAPSTADRYGVVEWGQLPNASLKPEKSRGWDAGVEKEFGDGAVTLDATYFENKFRNLFEWEYVNYVTYEGHIVNRAHASTSGVELSGTARLNPQVKVRGSYTYLVAHNDDTGARLIRRPRHSGDAEVQYQVTAPWLLGAGVHLIAANFDAPGAFGGYTTARLFTSYAVRSDLILKLRIENALNRRYEEVYGYPALPFGAFGSVEWRF